MNIQSKINAAIASAGQSLAVSKVLGSNVEEALAVRQDISEAQDRTLDAEENLQTYEYDRTDKNKYREALQRNLDARDAAKTQEENLVAYYRNLYKGVDETGYVDTSEFRRRLLPRRKYRGKTYTSDADEIMTEESKNG